MTTRGRPPTHDDALVSEIGVFVVVALMRENEPDVKRRGHTVRNKARKALGQSGPMPTTKWWTPSPPKRKKRHPQVYVSGGPLEPQTRPADYRGVEPPPAPSPVPGEQLCHPCLREDAKQRDRFARRFANQGNHVAAGREAREAARLRSLVQVSRPRKCRFHAGATRERRGVPEPTQRPPGLMEMEDAS